MKKTNLANDMALGLRSTVVWFLILKGTFGLGSFVLNPLLKGFV
jgi:hypothetical protein